MCKCYYIFLRVLMATFLPIGIHGTFGQSVPAFRNEQLPQQERINDLLSLLTIEEKVGLLIAS